MSTERRTQDSSEGDIDSQPIQRSAAALIELSRRNDHLSLVERFKPVPITSGLRALANDDPKLGALLPRSKLQRVPSPAPAPSEEIANNQPHITIEADTGANDASPPPGEASVSVDAALGELGSNMGNSQQLL